MQPPGVTFAGNSILDMMRQLYALLPKHWHWLWTSCAGTSIRLLPWFTIASSLVVAAKFGLEVGLYRLHQLALD